MINLANPANIVIYCIKNSYSFDGNIVKKDDVAVDVPICRE